MSTVSTVLFDEGALGKDQEQRLLANGKVKALAEALRVFSAAAANVPFVEDLGTRIRQALERPLTDGVIEGWKKWSELREFTDRSKHPPEEQNTYALAEHTVTSKYEYRLELHGLGMPWTLKVEAEIGLDVESGTLLIRDGRIWELRLGQVTCSGTLRVEGTEVIPTKKGKPIALPGVIKFEQGIAIPT